MKSKSYRLFKSSSIMITGIAVLLAGQAARATDLHWDANGASTAAVAPTGTWGTSIFWNTDSSGAASGVSQSSTLVDDNVFFSAGTNGTTGTVTVGTTQAANSITFDDPVSVTISGGTGITLGNTTGAGIFRTANAAATISTAVTLGVAGAQTAYNFSNSGTSLLTIGALTGTGTSSATTQTITVGSSSSGGITLNGIIADAAAGGKVSLNINNTSTGITTLSATNTFTGGISISAGTIKGNGGSAFGAGTITLGAAGSADALITSDNTTKTNAITLFGTGNTGSLRIAGGGSVGQNPTFSGPINLNGHDLTIGNGAASTSGVKVTGQITGSNTITFDNSNALVTGLTQIGATGNSPALFTGNVVVAAGPAELLANFSADNAFSVASGAKLNLAASNVTIGGLNNVSGAGGTVSSNGTSSRTLLLAGTGSYSFAGVIQNNTTGVITLTKNGSGTQVLSGSNTYSGTTTISSGILDMAGTNSSAGAVTLASGGTLYLNNASNGGLASGTLSLNGGTLEAVGAARSLSNAITLGGNSTFSGSQNIALDGVVTATNSRTLTNNMAGGTLTLSNELRLSSNASNNTLMMDGSGNTLVSGVVSNGMGGSTASNLIYGGSGTLTLSNAGNTYSGTTTVISGTLSLSSAFLADTSTVSIITGAILNLTHGSIDNVAVLEFDGLPQPAGFTYNAGNSGGFISGSGSIRVIAPSGYSTWASTNVGGQSPSQDFDNDGTSNGVEYFMNAPSGFTANPEVAGSAVKTVTWANAGNIPSSDYGTQFVVQTSTDLVNWMPVSSGDGNLSNTIGSIIYTITGSGTQFVRLKVTPN